MAPCLFLTFALFLVGGSVADRISGNYYVDWEDEANEIAPAYINFVYPFEQPGEIIPGLSVQDVMSVAGKAWRETEMREVFGLICRDIAPSLVVPLGAPFISSVCDPIFHSLNTNTRIDGRAICNAAYDHLGVTGYTRRRRRRMTDGKSMLGLGGVMDFNFEKVGDDIARRIFNLYGYDQESVCTAFDSFVNSEISTQRLVKDTGEIFLEEAIAQGSLVCQHWDAIYENLRLTDEQSGGVPGFILKLIEHVPRLIAELSGFENREALCEALVEASPPAHQHPSHDAGTQHAASVSSLADYILQHMFQTLTINERCNQFANDVIDVLLDFDIPYLDRDTMNYYVQIIFDLQSVGEACTFIDSTFAFEGCDIDSCANGGSCENVQDVFGNSFRCHCESGYAGTDCGIATLSE